MVTLIVLVCMVMLIRKACKVAPKLARFWMENPKVVEGGMHLMKRMLGR